MSKKRQFNTWLIKNSVSFVCGLSRVVVILCETEGLLSFTNKSFFVEVRQLFEETVVFAVLLIKIQ